MSATTTLSRQLITLTDSLRTTNKLITRLGKLQFQPGAEPLDAESSVRVELSQDIHDSLKQLTEDLETLRQETEDFSPETHSRQRRTNSDSEETRLSAKVVRLSEDLTEARQRFRTAQVAAKFASEQAKRRERQSILDGYRQEAAQLNQIAEPLQSARDRLFEQRKKNHQQKNQTRDEVLVSASSDVTAALRRTHDLLSTELTRSRFAQETFEQSTAALAQLGEDYSNLDTILSTSRNLIGTLLKSQKSDSWYLETAFYILIATLCWLIFRRLLYGPFFRLPLFIYNVSYFLVNWIVLKPLFLFLSITGVITTERAKSPGLAPAPSSSSRPSLIVQPSAQASEHAFPSANFPQGGVPAGAGGEGAKQGRNILQGVMSEQIGKAAEASSRPEGEGEQSGVPTSQEKEPLRRGDGTILQERGDIPANPKKKAFDTSAEDAKHEAQQRDEL